MKNWQQVLVSPTTSILKTIEIIDTSGAQIALVVDDATRLLGTVTDGDIRRGILQGIPLSASVQSVMNSAPITALAHHSRDQIMEKLKEKLVHQMPIVDDERRVIGLEIFDELLQAPEAQENWVVLMAGGMGTRLKPLTDNCPKPLLSVGNRPLLETTLTNLVASGFRKFFISVHYKSEMVEEYFGDGSKWGVQIRYLREDSQLGTAGALSLLPETPTRPVLVMNGDLLTKVSFRNLLKFHTRHKAQATMCVREYEFQVPYGVVKMDQETITAIDEKPIHNFFVNGGIYVLEPEQIRRLQKNVYLDMPNLFRQIMDRGEKTAAFPIREYWLDIGRMDDFERANGEFPRIFLNKA